MRKIITLLLLALGVTAQSFANTSDLPGYTSQTNIDYVGDNHTGHKFDIYYPNDDKPTHPVIIHVYGSAWQMNNMKGTDAETVGVAALEAGYIFVTPNHRASSDALFPAQINDIKAVVRYLRGNADKYGIDTSFIAMSGFSSGGHLAVLMGVTRNVREHTVGTETMDIEGSIGDYTNQSSWIHAVCEWSAPIDEEDKNCGTSLLPDDVLDALVGCSKTNCPDKHVIYGAYTYLDASDAPMMLVYGKSDEVVPYCMGKKFYDNLRTIGIDAEMYSHDGVHEVAAEFTDEMITFFNRIKAANTSTTSLDQISPKRSTLNTKRLINGQLFIQRGDELFNAQGTRVK